MRVLLVLGAVLLLACGFVEAATISGHVARSSDSGAIAGGVVYALRTADGEVEAQQATDANGDYALTVAAGSYFVIATATGFVSELYDGLPCPPCDGELASIVTVAAAQTQGGVDFTLDDAPVISGTIRRAGTLAPVEGAKVSVEGDDSFETFTDADGHYDAFVAPGVYSVRAVAAGLLGQFYGGAPCTVLDCDSAAATPVDVMAGDASAIDIALAPGGNIAGTLRRQSDLAPLDVPAQIELYRPDGSFLFSFQAFTPDYEFPQALPAASYRLVARPETGYLPKVWNNRACGGVDATTCVPEQGDAVVVAGAATTSGVDFALVRATASISGSVTLLADGTPLGEVTIRATREGDAQEFDTVTQSDGDYRLDVPLGHYTIRAFPEEPLAFEVFPGAQCLNFQTCAGTAQVLSLDQGDIGGIDFALAPLGTITIGVRDADSNALIAAELKVLLPGLEGPRQFFIGDGGTATIPVPSGGDVRFAAKSDGIGCGPAPFLACLGELYPGAPCPNLQCDIALGGAIAVAKGEAVSGIELALGKGAALAGELHVEGTLDPIAGGGVDVVDGNNVAVGFGVSDVDGAWLVDGLGSGPYFARTRAEGFLDELYDDLPCAGGACSPATGQSLEPTPGTTLSGIDFVLAPGARIRGKVRSATTLQPIANATVTVFDQAGVQVALAASASDGTYAVRALAGGSYRVRFDANGFDSQLYDGLACTAQSCEPVAATAVLLAPPLDKTGVDADLGGGGSSPQNPRLVYLNDCKPNGCTILPGNEDSRTNHSALTDSQRTLAAFPYSAATFSQVAACVRAEFAAFSITVTTQDPGLAAHREFMFSTLPSQLGMSFEVGGVSPWQCGVPLENSIAFGFAEKYGEDIGGLCNVAAHEIAHQLGLDHEYYCPDHMTYLGGCGSKTFADFEAQCGGYSVEDCYCGAALVQNSFEKLAVVAGLSTRIFSDGFEQPAAEFMLGRRLGPRADGVISCGTDTRRPNMLLPWLQGQ
jgi:hypothetical protein